MEWTRDIATQFIDLYRTNPCLWKINHPKYNNKSARKEAYVKLIKLSRKTNPKASLSSVRSRIQNMRGAFRKELKKIEKSRKSGVQEVYKPSLWYFDLLKFTKDQDAVDEQDSTSCELVEEILEEEPEVEEEDQDFQISISETSKTMRSPSYNSRVHYPAVKRKNEEYSSVKSQSSHKVDEFEALGICVAAKLRRMNPHQRLWAESLVYKVLNKGLLNRLNEDTDVIETNLTTVNHLVEPTSLAMATLNEEPSS